MFVPRRLLLPVVVLAVAAAPLFRFWLAAEGYRENLLGVLTPGSLDSLGLGALLAIVMARSGSADAGAIRILRWAKPLATASLLVLVALLIAERLSAGLPLPLMAPKQTVQGVVFGWLIFRAAEGFGGKAGRLLTAAPVVYLGRISYGVYLAHGLPASCSPSSGSTAASSPSRGDFSRWRA